jgi:streptogramin lyase
LSVTVGEFAVPTANAVPYGITTGPDGNLWFTERGADKVGMINPASHAISEFVLGTTGNAPEQITTGPDGNLWFTEYTGNGLGIINPTTHTVAGLALGSGSGPKGITLGPDNNLWFTEYDGNRIGHYDPATSVLAQSSLPAPGSGPYGIVTGPDGNLWFTEDTGNRIGEFNPSTGALTEFGLRSAGSGPTGITVGSDGNLWFTEFNSNLIGTINLTTHAISEFALPTGLAGPDGISVGPDGNLWFTELNAGQIGAINPVTHAVSEFAIPTAGSGPPKITLGPDGNLWFTEEQGDKIAQATPAPALTAAAGNGQSTPVATAFGTLLAVQVLDVQGNPLPEANVFFTLHPGAGGAGGSFTGSTTVTTNAQGLAFAPVVTANDTAGSFTVSASLGGTNGPSTLFNLTNLPGTPAVVSPAGWVAQNAPVGTAYSTPLQAAVTDAYGNPLPGVPVTFTVPATGASGTFAALSTVPTNAIGIATAPPLIANAVPGSFLATAAVAGLPNIFFGLTNTAVPATLRIVAGAAQRTTVGTAFGQLLKVKVTDAANQPVSGITVAFALSASGAGGTFNAPPLVVTDAQGVATAPALVANTQAGTFTVFAAVAGVASAARFILTNLPGVAQGLRAAAGTPQAGTVGKPFATALKAQVVDSYGNAVPVRGIKVTFTVVPDPKTGAGAAFAGQTTVTVSTNGSGVATAPPLTANPIAGSFTVTAAAAGFTGPPVTFALSTVPGPPFDPVGGPAQSATVNQPYAEHLTARVRDIFGNPVRGVVVVFTAPAHGAGGTFGGRLTAAAITGADGVAIAPPFTANTGAGPFVVRVTTPGVPEAGLIHLTNVPGPAALLTIVGGSTRRTAGSGTFSGPLEVRATDAFGNAIAGVPITFTVVANGASGSGASFGSGATATVLSNARGLAVAPALRANGKRGSFTVIASAAGVAADATFSLTIA